MITQLNRSDALELNETLAQHIANVQQRNCDASLAASFDDVVVDEKYKQKVVETILTLPQQSFEKYSRSFGQNMLHFAKNLNIEKFLLLPMLNNGSWQLNKFAVADTKKYFVDFKIPGDGILLDGSDIPDFFAHLFVADYTSSIATKIFFAGIGSELVMYLCDHGNLHVTVYSTMIDVRKGMRGSEFVFSANDECNVID